MNLAARSDRSCRNNDLAGHIAASQWPTGTLWQTGPMAWVKFLALCILLRAGSSESLTREPKTWGLLKTGDFSDVTVKCDDTVWQLHKTILCARSTYFAKALAGPFKEAATGKCDILEVNSEVFGEVVEFIYTGQIKKRALRLGSSFSNEFPGAMRHWYKLFLAADYFQLEDLMETVLARQSECLSGIAEHIQQYLKGLAARGKKRPETFLTSDAIDEFFSVVGLAYNNHLDTIKPYKKTLCTFIREIEHFVKVDARFQKHLEKVTLFRADLYSERTFNQLQDNEIIVLDW
ncbi:hypothetical protein PG994_011984 [Apiospora phragmitis]|uniref:BTB domain-containing protein n=1 Tax=Apiospora phragmitis TaxID=2905665 RepID=A0ABR1TX26_9PEZI